MTRFVIALILLAGAFPVCASEEDTVQRTDITISTLPLVKKELAGRGDFLKTSLKRLGNKTIELEAFSSIEGSFPAARRVLPALEKYPNWILPGINESPGGNKYYIQVQNLTVPPAPSWFLGVDFTLDLPVFPHIGKRWYRLATVEHADWWALEAETLPNPVSVIAAMQGALKVYPAAGESGRLWFHVKGQMKLKPWLLYEALPERLITREVGDRLQILLNNYRKEEDRIVASEAEPALETVQASAGVR